MYGPACTFMEFQSDFESTSISHCALVNTENDYISWTYTNMHCKYLVSKQQTEKCKIKLTVAENKAYQMLLAVWRNTIKQKQCCSLQYRIFSMLPLTTIKRIHFI